ncbi:hypothetical protein BK744_09360 [Bacillus thuringiensis serovar zhaodongensis]|nr:hypothetical protein BK744_09360 [Bacillus thuringiensis serovar zhaodongensis]
MPINGKILEYLGWKILQIPKLIEHKTIGIPIYHLDRGANMPCKSSVIIGVCENSIKVIVLYMVQKIIRYRVKYFFIWEPHI